MAKRFSCSPKHKYVEQMCFKWLWLYIFADGRVFGCFNPRIHKRGQMWFLKYFINENIDASLLTGTSPNLLFCSSEWVTGSSQWCILPYSTYRTTAFRSCREKFKKIKADNYQSVSAGWTCFAWYVWDYSWIPWPQDSYDRGTISDPAETFTLLLMQGWISLLGSWVMWRESFGICYFHLTNIKQMFLYERLER